MAAQTGRNIYVSKGATRLLGARAKSLSLNGEPVDVTNDDSLGWREVLAEFGVKSVDVEVEGVLKDGVLVAAWFTSGLAAYTVTVTGIGTFTGNWMLTSVPLAGSHDGEITYTGTLQSSGAITFTPA
jgi:predicted secreted protein